MENERVIVALVGFVCGVAEAGELSDEFLHSEGLFQDRLSMGYVIGDLDEGL